MSQHPRKRRLKPRRQSKSARRQLLFESLEDRRVLAATVTESEPNDTFDSADNVGTVASVLDISGRMTVTRGNGNSPIGQRERIPNSDFFKFHVGEQRDFRFGAKVDRYVQSPVMSLYNSERQLLHSAELPSANGVMFLENLSAGDYFLLFGAPTNFDNSDLEPNYTIAVEPASNNRPVVVNHRATVLEGDTASLHGSHLSATDVDSDNGTLLFTLKSLPLHGTLKKDGMALSLAASFTQNDIEAGKISYSHAGGNEANDSFSFTVRDSNGGETDVATFEITVNGVDDTVPTVGNRRATITEGGTVTLTASELSAADPDSVADSLIFVVKTPPYDGQLRRDGVPLATDSTFTTADITAGKISYAHGGGFDDDRFTFTIRDQVGNESTLQLFQIAVIQSTQYIVSGHANPYLAGLPNGSTAFAGDSAPAQSPLRAIATPILPGSVLTFEATGSASNNGMQRTWGPNGTGMQRHTPGAENGIADMNGPTSSLVGVFLSDDRPDASAPPDSLDFAHLGLDYGQLRPLLKQPFFIGDGNLHSVTVPEGATRLFLGTWDGGEWNNNSGEIQVSVTAHATGDEDLVRFDGLYVTLEGSDRVEFLAANTWARSTIATTGNYPTDVVFDEHQQEITWNEQFGTARIAPAAGGNATTLLTDVNGLALAHDATNGQFYLGNGNKIERVNRDGSRRTTIIDNLITITGIALDVSRGRLYWSSVSANSYIAVANLDGSNIRHIIDLPGGSPESLAVDPRNDMVYWVDQFSHTVERVQVDGTGRRTLVQDNSGLPAPKSVVIDTASNHLYVADVLAGAVYRYQLDGSGKEVLAQNLPGPEGLALGFTRLVNVPPSVVNHGAILAEGATLVLGSAHLSAADADSPATELVFTVRSTPATGRIRKDGAVLGTNETFTQADIVGGKIAYTHDGGNTTSDRFTFTVKDDAGNETAITNFDFTITPVDDDRPVVGHHTAILEESESLILGAAHLSATDADSDAATLVFTVKSVPFHGQLNKDGTVLAVGGSFTQSDITGGKIAYAHDGIGTTNDRFTFTVKDVAGNETTDTTFDMTLAASPGIRGRIWDDRNGNGSREADEPGLPGVRVYLDLNANGVLDRDTSGRPQEPSARTRADNPATPSDETGEYEFSGLDPGIYTVAEIPLAGWEQTYPGSTRPAIVRLSADFDPSAVGDYSEPYNWPSVSGDGRFVAFDSVSSEMVSGDTNRQRDVFVFDRATSSLELVSRSSVGTLGDGNSTAARVSADGQFVAFVSSASNLVPGDTNGVDDVFVRNRRTDTTERVSLSLTGSEADGASHDQTIDISDDGRYVVFSSSARNLIPTLVSGYPNLFVRDRVLGTTELISTALDGSAANGHVGWVSISGDGRFVAFSSQATNLVPEAVTGSQVYVRDRLLNTTELVSFGSNGSAGNGTSDLPDISRDGRYVVFQSDATNLVANDTNHAQDVFIRDRVTGITEVVSVAPNGAQANSVSFQPTVSGDGRYVAYASAATNLVMLDTNLAADAFLFDRQMGHTDRISFMTTGAPADGSSFVPIVSADGSTVVFGSSAALVPSDDNSEEDIYVAFLGGRVQGAHTVYVPATTIVGQVDFGVHGNFPYHNDRNGSDVDGDGFVTSTDRLIVLDAVEADGPHALPAPTSDYQGPFYDAYPDNALTALDVHTVATFLDSCDNQTAEDDCTLVHHPDQDVRLRFATVDLQGNPVTEITQGQEFLLELHVKDMGVSNTTHGLFAAYLDVVYDSGLVSPVAADIAAARFGPAFEYGRSANFATLGFMDEIGAFAGPHSPPGSVEQLLFSVRMLATQAGLAVFTADPAEGLGHEVLVFGDPLPLDWSSISFASAGLTIVPVTSVDDDRPVVGNRSATLAEGASLTLGANHLSATDADSDAATLVFTVKSLPAYGQWKKDGVALAVDGTFTQADIAAGKIAYVHDGSNTANDSFTFTVKDSAGNETAIATFDVTVTSVDDDRPVVGNRSATLAEGASLTLGANHLSATDADSDAATLVFTVKSLPAYGQWKKDGVALAVDGTFTQTDIASGKIAYVHDGSNTANDSFTFTVKDSAGNETAIATFDVTVTSVDDDRPVVGNRSVTLAEGASLTLGANHLSATDADSDAATLVFTVKSLPAYGQWKKDGVALAVDGTFTQADIAAGKIAYAHDGSNTANDSFTFTVKDSAGNETAIATFDVTVTSVDDDRPVVGNRSVTLAEGASLTLGANHLSATDADSDAATLVFTVKSLPAYGPWKKDGVALAVDGTFTQADIASGKIAYVHDGSNTANDSFTFTVKDSAGNETAIATFDVTVTSVDDDRPVVGNRSATLAEGASLTLGANHLSATDADSDAATLVFTVKSLPAYGQWKKDGVALAVDGTFTQADIAAGKIAYAHDGSNTANDSFTFTVKDSAGNETAVATFDVTVTSVDDDRPVVGNRSATLAEGTSLTLGANHLSATDADSDAATLVFTVKSLPAHGQWKKDGVALAVDSTFTQADIAAGKIAYAHDGSNTANDSFTFTVKDSAGNETAVATFDVTVTSVDDDRPVVGNRSVTLAEGASLTLGANHLSATDADSDAATLVFTVKSLPAHGQWKKDGVALAVDSTFTQADIVAGKIAYAHDGSNTANDSFTFTVKDSAGNETAVATFDVTVTSVDDDRPVVGNRSVTLAEGASLTLGANHLSATDADSDAATLVFTVKSLPAYGPWKKDGVALAVDGTFTQADIAAGKIAYAHDGSNTANDSFTFTVKDSAGNETAITTFDVTVTSVDDDRPVVGNRSATLAEGTSLTLGAHHLSATDADSDAATLVFTVKSLPAYGQWKKDGVALAVDGTFTQADIAAGKIAYAHDGSNTANDSFTFTVKDGAGNETAVSGFSVLIESAAGPRLMVSDQVIASQGQCSVRIAGAASRAAHLTVTSSNLEVLGVGDFSIAADGNDVLVTIQHRSADYGVTEITVADDARPLAQFIVIILPSDSVTGVDAGKLNLQVETQPPSDQHVGRVASKVSYNDRALAWLAKHGAVAFEDALGLVRMLRGHSSPGVRSRMSHRTDESSAIRTTTETAELSTDQGQGLFDTLDEQLQKTPQVTAHLQDNYGATADGMVDKIKDKTVSGLFDFAVSGINKLLDTLDPDNAVQLRSTGPIISSVTALTGNVTDLLLEAFSPKPSKPKIILQTVQLTGSLVELANAVRNVSLEGASIGVPNLAEEGNLFSAGLVSKLALIVAGPAAPSQLARAIDFVSPARELGSNLKGFIKKKLGFEEVLEGNTQSEQRLALAKEYIESGVKIAEHLDAIWDAVFGPDDLYVDKDGVERSWSENQHRYPTASKDNVTTGTGHDTVDSGPGDDKIQTNAGNDTVRAGGGDNRVDTGTGDDAIIDGDGDSFLTAGAGADVVEDGGGNDVINLGPGRDKLVYEGRNIGRDLVYDTGRSGEIQLLSISLDELSFAKQGDDLAISRENAGATLNDQIRIADFFRNEETDWSLRTRDRPVVDLRAVTGRLGHQDSVRLALQTYEDTPPTSDSLPVGLLHDATITDPLSGLHAEVFTTNGEDGTPDPAHLYVVVRGDQSELENWVVRNAGLGLRQANALINRLTLTYSVHQLKSVTLVGHGSAGMVIQWVGTHFASHGIPFVNVTTLNAPDISGHIRASLSDDFPEFSFGLPNLTITHVIHRDDPISKLGLYSGSGFGTSTWVTWTSHRESQESVITFDELLAAHTPRIGDFSSGDIEFTMLTPLQAQRHVGIRSSSEATRFLYRSAADCSANSFFNLLFGGSNVDSGKLAGEIDSRALEEAAFTRLLRHDPHASISFSEKFDFGPVGSNVEPGHIRISENTLYVSKAGWDVLNDGLTSQDRGRGSDLERDFVATSGNTFIVDLPAPGTYNVSLITGDRAEIRESMVYYVNGFYYDTVSTMPGQILTHGFQVTTSDPQLRIAIKDRGGNSARAVINGLAIEKVPFGSESPGSTLIQDDELLVVMTHGYKIPGWVEDVTEFVKQTIQAVKDVSSVVSGYMKGGPALAAVKATEVALRRIREELTKDDSVRATSRVGDWVFELADAFAAMSTRYRLGRLDANVIPVDFGDAWEALQQGKEGRRLLNLWQGSRDFLALDWTDESSEGHDILDVIKGDFSEVDHRNAVERSAQIYKALIDARIEQLRQSDPTSKLDVLLVSHSFGYNVHRELATLISSSDTANNIDYLKVVTLDPVSEQSDELKDSDRRSDTFPWPHPELTPAVDNVENYYQTEGVFHSKFTSVALAAGLIGIGVHNLTKNIEDQLISGQPLDGREGGGVVGFYNRQARVFDLVTEKEILRFRHWDPNQIALSSAELTDIEFNQDGSLVAASGMDGIVSVRYANDIPNPDPTVTTPLHYAGETKFEVWGHESNVRSVSFIEIEVDGHWKNFLLTASDARNPENTSISKNKILLTDVETGTPVWQGLDIGATQVEASPSGNVIVSTDENGHAKVWQRVEGTVTYAQRGTSVSVHPGGAYVADLVVLNDRFFVTAGLDGRMKLVEIADDGPRVKWTYQFDNPGQGKVRNLDYDPYNGILAVASGNELSIWRFDQEAGTISVWAPEGYPASTVFGRQDHTKEVQGVAFSKPAFLFDEHGQYQGDRHLPRTQFGDVDIGQLPTWLADRGKPNSLAGLKLVTGGEDRTIYLYALDQLHVGSTPKTGVLSGAMLPIRELTLSPDGRRVAVVGQDNIEDLKGGPVNDHDVTDAIDKRLGFNWTELFVGGFREHTEVPIYYAEDVVGVTGESFFWQRNNDAASRSGDLDPANNFALPPNKRASRPGLDVERIQLQARPGDELQIEPLRYLIEVDRGDFRLDPQSLDMLPATVYDEGNHVLGEIRRKAVQGKLSRDVLEFVAANDLDFSADDRVAFTGHYTVWLIGTRGADGVSRTVPAEITVHVINHKPTAHRDIVDLHPNRQFTDLRPRANDYDFDNDDFSMIPVPAAWQPVVYKGEEVARYRRNPDDSRGVDIDVTISEEHLAQVLATESQSGQLVKFISVEFPYQVQEEKYKAVSTGVVEIRLRLPAGPENVRYDELGADQVLIRWDPVSWKADKYVVERYEDGIGWVKHAPNSDVDGNGSDSLRIKIAPNTAYWFRVVAKNTNTGRMHASYDGDDKHQALYVPATDYVGPASVTMENRGPAQIEVRWEKVYWNVDRYRIDLHQVAIDPDGRLRRDANGDWVFEDGKSRFVVVEQGEGLSFVFRELSPGTPYLAVVTAKNGENADNQIAKSTPAAAPVHTSEYALPAGIQFERTGPQKVYISWATASFAEKYRAVAIDPVTLERVSVSETVIADNDKNTNSVVLRDLQEQHTYVIIVEAKSRKSGTWISLIDEEPATPVLPDRDIVPADIAVAYEASGRSKYVIPSSFSHSITLPSLSGVFVGSEFTLLNFSRADIPVSTTGGDIVMPGSSEPLVTLPATFDAQGNTVGFVVYRFVARESTSQPGNLVWEVQIGDERSEARVLTTPAFLAADANNLAVRSEDSSPRRLCVEWMSPFWDVTKHVLEIFEYDAGAVDGRGRQAAPKKTILLSETPGPDFHREFTELQPARDYLVVLTTVGPHGTYTLQRVGKTAPQNSPNDLTVENTALHGFTAAWTAVPWTPQGYRVVVQKLQGAEWVSVREIEVGKNQAGDFKTNLFVAGLEPGTEYQFTVEAKSGLTDTWVANSKWKTVKTRVFELPPNVALETPERTGHSILVDWDKAFTSPTPSGFLFGADEVTVYWREVGASGAASSKKVAAETSSYQIRELGRGNEYEIWVEFRADGVATSLVLRTAGNAPVLTTPTQPPTKVTFAEQTWDSFRVGWDPPTDNDHDWFNIKVSADGGGTWVDAETVAGNVANNLDKIRTTVVLAKYQKADGSFTKFKAGTTYLVRIAAVYDNGDKRAYSNVNGDPVTTADYGVPFDVQGLNPTMSTIDITWEYRDPVGNPESFEIQQSVDDGRTWHLASTLKASPGPRVKPITELDPGTSYRFRVKAVFSANDSTVSDASPPISTKPVPVVITQVVVGGKRKATVFWDALPAAPNTLLIEARPLDAADQPIGDWSVPTGGTISEKTRTSKEITELLPGTKYLVRLVAINILGVRDEGPAVSMTTEAFPPITGVDTSKPALTEVTVEWTRLETLDSDANVTRNVVEVYLDGTLLPNSPQIGSGTGAKQTLKVSGLVSGTTYEVKVVAYNGNIRLSESDRVEFSTLTDGLTVLEVAPFSAQANWTQFGGSTATDYRVQVFRSGASTPEKEKVVSVGSGIRRTTMGGLAPATTYEMVIQALRNQKVLSYSERVPFTTTSISLNNVTSTDVRRVSMDVAWDSVGDWADWTKVQWRKVGATNWTGSGELGGGRVAYTIEGLDRNTQYQIRVSAGGGGETREATITRTTKDFVPPSAPRFSNVTKSSMTVNWSHSDPAGAPDSFAIFRDGKKVGEVGSSARSFVDNGLKAGVTYSYYVRAKYPLGNSDGPSGSQKTTSNSSSGSITMNTTVNNGYIANATVFLDANANGVQDYLDLNANGVRDEGEPLEPSAMTGSSGDATLVIPPEFDRNSDGVIDSTEGTYVAVGGLDVVTMLPLASALVAPAGASVITPLTTVLSEVMARRSVSAEEASAMVEKHFGLPSVGLAHYDLIQGVIQQDDSASVAYAALARVHDTAVQIGQLLHGNGVDFTTAVRSAFSALADEIALESSAGLEDNASVASLVRKAARDVGKSFDDELVAAASQVIVAGNQRLGQIVAESGESFLTEVKRVQSIEMGEVANSLSALGAGNLAPDEAVQSHTGSGLEARIAVATVGAIVPTRHRFTVEEMVAGQLIGDLSLPVAAGTSPAVTVSDDRFEAKSGKLWLKEDRFLEYVPDQEIHVTVVVAGEQSTTASIQGYDISVQENLLPWKNQILRVDVNGDGLATPIDALIVINDLNELGARALAIRPAMLPGLSRYLDVDGDKNVSPLDALNVINYLNAERDAQGGEAESQSALAVRETNEWNLLIPATVVVDSEAPSVTRHSDDVQVNPASRGNEASPTTPTCYDAVLEDWNEDSAASSDDYWDFDELDGESHALSLD